MPRHFLFFSALQRNWKLWRRTSPGLWTGDQNLSLNAGMRTSFTSAISFPRFLDSCVPLCTSFWFHRSLHWVFASCLVVLPGLRSSFFFFLFISFLIGYLPLVPLFFQVLFYLYFVFIFIFTRVLFLYYSQKAVPPPPPRCQMAVHRTVPHSGPIPFPNLTPLFWSFGSINAWWSALSRKTQSCETIPASVKLKFSHSFVFMFIAFFVSCACRCLANNPLKCDTAFCNHKQLLLSRAYYCKANATCNKPTAVAGESFHSASLTTLWNLTCRKTGCVLKYLSRESLKRMKHTNARLLVFYFLNSSGSGEWTTHIPNHNSELTGRQLRWCGCSPRIRIGSPRIRKNFCVQKSSIDIIQFFRHRWYHVTCNFFFSHQ